MFAHMIAPIVAEQPKAILHANKQQMPNDANSPMDLILLNVPYVALANKCEVCIMTNQNKTAEELNVQPKGWSRNMRPLETPQCKIVTAVS